MNINPFQLHAEAKNSQSKLPSFYGNFYDNCQAKMENIWPALLNDGI